MPSDLQHPAKKEHAATVTSRRNRPFVEVFREARGTASYAEIAARTKELDPAGRGISRSFLSLIAAGIEPPVVRAMALVAAALDIDPAEFVEYRLAAARAALDERNEGGLQAAAAELDRIESQLGPFTAAPVLGFRKLAS